MSVVEKFATAGVAPPERLRYWNDLVDRVYGGTFVNTPDQDFSGEMWCWSVGELDMIRPRSGPSMVGRLPRDSASERIILHLQCRGTSQHRQDGVTSVLEPGDFVLGSPHRPYAIDLSAHELLVVEFPRQPLVERFPGLDDALSRRMCGSSPGGRVFHDFLLSLWHQGDQGMQDPEWEQGVNAVFYDLAALAMRGAGRDEPRKVETAFRNRVLAVVDAQLCDPFLRTTTIAQACNASVRTVQNLFAAMGTTPSGYILERRLLRASDRLLARPEASITEVAFEHGFNDSAYFTRCFRQHFGLAPREWRSRP
ncbi:helix-turn-helix domain-containing protein [Novosphingobium lentum]|uniref:helix-turn-helix domain-containing protein n=1 Tax=Novosphingobium lentum TaxID=145287 RepID=UPI00083559B8|nr:helix-turn-helix domain-containing protein [Novosphingobium lentum]